MSPMLVINIFTSDSYVKQVLAITNVCVSICLCATLLHLYQNEASQDNKIFILPAATKTPVSVIYKVFPVNQQEIWALLGS